MVKRPLIHQCQLWLVTAFFFLLRMSSQQIKVVGWKRTIARDSFGFAKGQAKAFAVFRQRGKTHLEDDLLLEILRPDTRIQKISAIYFFLQFFNLCNAQIKSTPGISNLLYVERNLSGMQWTRWFLIRTAVAQKFNCIKNASIK